MESPDLASAGCSGYPIALTTRGSVLVTLSMDIGIKTTGVDMRLSRDEIVNPCRAFDRRRVFEKLGNLARIKLNRRCL